MRYWVYINDKVEGPYEEDKLVTLSGFNPDTLICSEEIEAGGSQEWIKASSVFEFDPLQNTINQPFPVQEDLQTAPLTSASDETAAQSYAQPANGVSSDVSHILIEKLDKLTQEIEDLKSKLDEAITAGAMSKTADEQPRNFVDSDSSAHTITLTQADIPADHVQEDALITSTASLVSQAESLIAEAKSAETPEEKSVDFLQTVDLGVTQTNHTVPAEEPLPKEGEEVVLRSALDSLYNAKIQSEEEKEATFQDLLTPKQAADLHKAVQQPGEHQKTLDDVLKEEEAQSPVKEETPAPTEAEKDAFLKELTDHPQEDVISKLIEEKQEEAQTEQNEFAADAAALAAGAAAAGAALAALNETKEEPAPEPVQAEEPQPEPIQAEEQPAEPVQEPEPAADLPSADSMPESSPEAPAEKQALNLEDGPELNIAEDVPSEPEPASEEKQDLNLENQPELNIAETPAEEPVAPVTEEPAPEPETKPEEQPQAQPVFSGNMNDLPSLEEAARQNLPSENQDQKEETLQELVPGAKMEAPDRNTPLTEADLREAFAERPAAEEMTVAQDLDAKLQEEQPQPQESAAAQADIAPLEQTTSTESLPMGEGNFNPNDLTEIELKEGSTYLISDFVPPAQANEVPKEIGGLKNVQRDDLGGGKVQGADVMNADPNVKTQTISDGIEEMMPAAKQQPAPAEDALSAVQEGAPDVTISKVILENTIKTKRGASLDIKTVPMVPEPAQTGRLDLGNTDLEDINAQHDLKAADVKPAGGMTKIIIGGLVSVVILAIIYVMLAFLNLIPAQYNLINSAPVKSDQEQTAQLNEMLGQEPPAAVPANPSAALPQQQPAVNPMEAVITEVQNFPLSNGMTLRQLIEARHPAMRGMIEWDATTAVDPDNYSILVKVPPENPQSFKISYRFNYNTLTQTLDPTISDSKNLLDSVRGAAMPQQPMQQQPAPVR